MVLLITLSNYRLKNLSRPRNKTDASSYNCGLEHLKEISQFPYLNIQFNSLLVVLDS